MGSKLTSRKFWMAVGGGAAGAASVISGLVVPNEKAQTALVITGGILMAASVVAYNIAEALVDGKAVAANTTSTETKVTATATGPAANNLVAATIAPTEKEATNG